jgi:hypothetical protein
VQKVVEVESNPPEFRMGSPNLGLATGERERVIHALGVDGERHEAGCPTLKEGLNMKHEVYNSDEVSNSNWIREQTQEQTDTWVGLTLMRLHHLRDARARGDSAVAERATASLVGVFLMTGISPRGAGKRVSELLEWIDTTAPEALVCRYWRKDVTMFQLMDGWRKFLGHQHRRGTDVGVTATRFQLLGALLACGLSYEAALERLRMLEHNAAVVP